MKNRETKKRDEDCGRKSLICGCHAQNASTSRKKKTFEINRYTRLKVKIE